MQEQAQQPDINAIRTAAVSQEFHNSVGYRALLLTDSFPFLIIGMIDSVTSDFLSIDVETTHIPELEGRTMRVHLDEIEVFYIEDHEHPIPQISPAGRK